MARFPLGDRATEVTLAVWPFRLKDASLPVNASHSLASLSSPPVMTRLPSRENAACRTACWCPTNSTDSWPVSASQMRAVLSFDAVSTRVPVGREHRAADSITMTVQGLEQLPGVCIPDAGCLVVAGGHDFGAVGRKRRVVDVLAVPAVEPQFGHPGLRVPDPCAHVPTAGDDALAIGRESRRGHRVVRTESHVLPALLHVPETRLVAADR